MEAYVSAVIEDYIITLCPSPSKPSAAGFMEGSFWQCCRKLRFGW